MKEDIVIVIKIEATPEEVAMSKEKFKKDYNKLFPSSCNKNRNQFIGMRNHLLSLIMSSRTGFGKRQSSF